MSLSGEGAICIWNDITDQGEAEFYAWHIEEHIPERVGIPGFTRGRRYIACDEASEPKFFTLYETATPEVHVGQDYMNRLNAPTEWTRRATQGFRNTFRALTRVKASFGPGTGGILMTLRLSLPPESSAEITRALALEALPSITRLPQITGVHLCVTDAEASAGRTAESKDRSDIQDPPNTVVLIEGCNPEQVQNAAEALIRHPAFPEPESVIRGLYRLEYTRLKTAHSPG